MINQLRENIGNPYKPYKIPCGTAIAHACSQILWFTKGSLLDEKYKEVSSGYSNPTGNLVSVQIEKNKVTKNDRRPQTYTLNYSTGVDEIKDTLDLALLLGIISQGGAWYKTTLKSGKEQKMQGFNGVQEFYYNDLEELEYLRMVILSAGVWDIWWSLHLRSLMMRNMKSGDMMISQSFHHNGIIRLQLRPESSLAS